MQGLTLRALSKCMEIVASMARRPILIGDEVSIYSSKGELVLWNFQGPSKLAEAVSLPAITSSQQPVNPRAVPVGLWMLVAIMHD